MHSFDLATRDSGSERADVPPNGDMRQVPVNGDTLVEGEDGTTTDSQVDFAARLGIASDFDQKATDGPEYSAERPSLSGGSSPIRNANKRLTFAEAASRIVEHGERLASERIPLSQLKVEGKSVIANGREFRPRARGVSSPMRSFRCTG